MEGVLTSEVGVLSDGDKSGPRTWSPHSLTLLYMSPGRSAHCAVTEPE